MPIARVQRHRAVLRTHIRNIIGKMTGSDTDFPNGHLAFGPLQLMSARRARPLSRKMGRTMQRKNDLLQGAGVISGERSGYGSDPTIPSGELQAYRHRHTSDLSHLRPAPSRTPYGRHDRRRPPRPTRLPGPAVRILRRSWRPVGGLAVGGRGKRNRTAGSQAGPGRPPGGLPR